MIQLQRHTNHRLVILLSAALVLVPASLAESETAVIQDDGESGTDAPNECVARGPSGVDLVHDGTYGELVPVDDPVDVFTTMVKEGQTVEIVQSLPSDSTFGTVHAPHAPHLPHGDALHDDNANPFGLEVRDRDCALVARSDDPSVLPRTITLSAAGTYQVVLFESKEASVSGVHDGGRSSETYMCHPPCIMDGYLVDRVPV